jgi:Phage portal protein
MHVIDRLLGRPSASGDLKKRNPSDDYWYRPLSRPVAAVTVQKALTLPVVYDCGQVLSQTVGTLPWGIFERKSDGSKARCDRHPLAFVFADPNPETATGEFLGQIEFDLVTEGDAFLEIEAGELARLRTCGGSTRAGCSSSGCLTARAATPTAELAALRRI